MDSVTFAIVENLFQDAYASWKAAASFAAKCNRNCIVTPGFPILWFGDLDAYLKKSPEERAITIGVNPSGQELRRNKSDSFIRFPNCPVGSEEIDVGRYIEAMNCYFQVNPLKWFERGMEEVPFKYKDGSLIHIDCCSTIATRPTWTGLCNSMRELLRKDNKPIFEKLLLTLNPSIIYITSNKSEKAYIEDYCKTILKLDNTSVICIDKY